MYHFRILRSGWLSVPLALLLVWLGAAPVSADNVIGVGTSEMIHSSILDEDREIKIRLPESYNGSDKSYPVIYLNFGELFFEHVAVVAEFLARNERIPESIVVGITNPNRRRDMVLPGWRSRTGEEGIYQFSRFLQEELIPYIDSQYRTVDYRILYGHSIASGFALFTMLTSPDMFDGYIASSTFFGWRDSTLLHLCDSVPDLGALEGRKLFFSRGGREGDVMRRSHVDFENRLAARKVNMFQWSNKEYPDLEHMETPLMSVYDGLQFVFSDWKIFQNGDALTLLDYQEHYRYLSDRYGFRVAIPENSLVGLGYALLRSNKIDEALKVFRIGTEEYPNSFNAYDSYAEALLISGDTAAAILNYEKSLKLNPDNTNAGEVLERLRN